MARRKFLCFVHVERAGGTTLKQLLANLFPTYVSLKPWYCWANEPENCFMPAELVVLHRWLPFLAGVGGHTTRSWLDYEGAVGREVFRFTFMRDPIKRYMSHFNYQRIMMGVDWRIEEFLAESRFDNYHTRRYAGHASVERAKRALDEEFDFVGLTDRFDESVLLFRDALGEPQLSVLYERVNALPDAGVLQFEELSTEIQERIRDANALDLELYEYARDRVFPRFVERFDGDLAASVARHQEENRGYRFPWIRRRLASRYQALVRSTVEAVAHTRYDGIPVLTRADTTTTT